MQTLSALATVLGCVLVTFAVLPAVLRMLGHGREPGQSRKLRVLESLSLGGRQRLHLVDVDGERLLISSTESGVALLRRVPGRAEPDVERVPDELSKEKPRLTSRLATRWLPGLGRVSGIAVFFLLFLVDPSLAAPAELSAGEDAARISLSLDGLTAPDQLSSTLQIVALMTLVSVSPSILLMATSFTRILIVLSLLRQAMGTHQLPPNQVVVALALFTTIYVMAPVGEQIYSGAIEPYMAEEIGAPEALERSLTPARRYLMDHTRQKDLLLFIELSGDPAPDDLDGVALATLMPAYLVSEIRTSFEIGFMIYLPFLVIDLVIASMLISMGMIVLPPMMISLPFKLMLFVLLDGWNLLLRSLVLGLQ